MDPTLSPSGEQELNVAVHFISKSCSDFILSLTNFCPSESKILTTD